MAKIPSIIKGDKTFDINSELFKNRIIILDEDVTDALASSIISQLLYLDSVDSEKDIYLIIRSFGGSIAAGFAILDTMNCIKSNVSTICAGLAMSMGAVIFSAGQKGKRYVLPNAELMIHQPSCSAKGPATDVEITANHILGSKQRIARVLAKNCGQNFDVVSNDLLWDKWFSAEEAVEYGLADKIITELPFPKEEPKEGKSKEENSKK